MQSTKPWYTSRTVWGALVAIGASVLGLWEVDISQVEQARATDAIVQVVGALGGAVALFGRLSAKRRLE